ncbi:glycosyltransferase [candidate division WOR-3 bacterium]|jgi:glycosyltransferase involved in cell wall biosynthesis|nr:glycosyltransferase [candidate division WOR-3 bacterium]
MGNNRKDKKDTLIIHSITKLDIGGAQKILLEILMFLKKQGYNIKLIAGNGGGLFYKFKNSDIEIIEINELRRSINPIYDILAFLRIRNKLLEFRKEYKNIIIHTHTPKAGIITRIAAKLCNINDIYHTIHGWGFFLGQSKVSFFIFIFIERITAKFTNKLISVSNYVKDIGLKYKIGDKDKYKTIYNSVERRSIIINTDIVREKLYIDKKKKIVLQVSCLKAPKSPLDFIKIAEKMKSNKNLLFILAGEGILRNSIEIYIKKYKINNVRLLGWHKNIDELYQIASLCTLTSVSEGMPLTILEELSYNIPIVATDIGPNKEILNNYKYLCKPHDIDCFVRNINKLIKISKKIKYNFNYTKKEMLRKYEILYDL